MMKRCTALIALALLAGCSTSPLIQSVSSLSAVGSSLSARSSAPFTRSQGGSPGALIEGSTESGTSGRSETYGNQRVSVQLEEGTVRLNAQMLEPSEIRGIPQRYNNDCGQAAISTVLNFYGVAFEGESLYEGVAKRMSPMAWGTRIEDVVSFLNGIEGYACTPVRQASIEYLQGLLAQGKPVTVILSIQGVTTTMHFVVVIGTSETAGQRFVFYRDPANSDPEGVGILDEQTFLSAWDNQPIRSSWWSGLASFMANTNPANYERIAFDFGRK
ncbi:MAG: C39 family peptidase [Bacteroidota bacterium]